MNAKVSIGLAASLAPPATNCQLDLEHPSDARVCDFLLGGSVHWAVDRAFGRQIMSAVPEFCDVVLAHRQFVQRVVRHLAQLGVRQFVDIGSGLLSKDNTHQLADEVAPDSRVVYVDNDPVTVAHIEVLLDDEGDPDRHAVINADLRDPSGVWSAVLDTGLVDRSTPVAIFLFSVLHHFKPDAEEQDLGARAVEQYRDLLDDGSYLGISHVTREGVPDELGPRLDELKRLCEKWYGDKVYSRSHTAIGALLGDFKVLHPGLVWTPQWHPEAGERSVCADEPNAAAVMAAVGQKQTVPRTRVP